MGIPLHIAILPLSIHKGETEQEETETGENEKETEDGRPMVDPSSGRDASLVFKDLMFNTQALG